MGLNLPIAVYDVAGYLIPGMVVPFVLGIAFPNALELYHQGFWFMVVFSWIAGQFVQALSGLFYSRIISRICTRKTLLTERPKLKKSILSALGEFYQEDFAPDIEENHIKNLCYSPVWDRMDNYKIFVALADLSRALGFLAILAFMGALALVFGWRTNPIFGHSMVRALLVVTPVAFFVFTDRYHFFRKNSDIVVYYSFLSFIAERKAKVLERQVRNEPSLSNWRNS